jgi:hypothetical protein
MSDRLVAWFIIGGSSNDQARRQVGYPAIFGPGKFGWIDFIGKYVDPVVQKMRDAGLKPRICIGNPFGTLANEAMQFDQRIHAEQGVVGVHQRLPWLYQGFEFAWRQWTRRNSDTEAICYLGTLDGDSQFSALENAGAADQWLRRLAACIEPALGTRMSIGWDASAGVEQTSAAYCAMALVQSLGVNCYVEARPTKPHLAGWPVICIDTSFYRTDPDVYQDAKNLGHLPNARLGRTMLLINGLNEADRQQRIAAAWAGGYDVAFLDGDVDFAIQTANS